MDKIKIALNMGTNLFETVNFYYKEENFLYNCASAFKELRKQEKFCDIETTTKNRKITAHRVILAAVAPRFFNEICTKNVFKTENIVYQGGLHEIYNFKSCTRKCLKVQTGRRSHQVPNFD